MAATNPARPVRLADTSGDPKLVQPLADLSQRFVASGRTVVFRAGDVDVVRASTRPYMVIAARTVSPQGATRGVAGGAAGGVAYRKVSWHHTRDGADARLAALVRERPGPGTAYAIVEVDRS